MQSKTPVRDRRSPEALTTAVDTSVVVAVLLDWHEQHAVARAALETSLRRGDSLVLPGHVLVETYSVLTRLPSRHRVAPEIALALLDAGFRSRARVVTLTPGEIWPLLARCSRDGVAGGLTYDARILAAARKARADVLLTFDVRDYERLDVGSVRVERPQ